MQCLVNGRILVGWRFPGVEVGLGKFVAKDRWVDGMQQVGLQLRQHMFKLRPKIGAGGREEGGREGGGGRFATRGGKLDGV